MIQTQTAHVSTTEFNMTPILQPLFLSFSACQGDCLGVACTASNTCCPYYGTNGTCITNCTSNVIISDFTCKCYAICSIFVTILPCSCMPIHYMHAGSNVARNASQSVSLLTTAIIGHSLTTSSKRYHVHPCMHQLCNYVLLLIVYACIMHVS